MLCRNSSLCVWAIASQHGPINIRIEVPRQYKVHPAWLCRSRQLAFGARRHAEGSTSMCNRRGSHSLMQARAYTEILGGVVMGHVAVTRMALPCALCSVKSFWHMLELHSRWGQVPEELYCRRFQAHVRSQAHVRMCARGRMHARCSTGSRSANGMAAGRLPES